MIVGETTLSDFHTDIRLQKKYFERCHVIHFTDGLVDRIKIQRVIDVIRGISIEKAVIKLSMSLRNRDGCAGTGGVHPCVEPVASELLVALSGVIDFVDYIELDSITDLDPAILAIIPVQKRIITCYCKMYGHGEQALPSLLGAHQLLTNNVATKVDAYLYRFITDDGLLSLEFLHKIKAVNVLSYDESEQGIWSRLCSIYKGAPVIFTKLGSGCSTSFEFLQNNYELYSLPGKIDCLYGIVSSSFSNQSLSPLVHNKALRALQIPALYLSFVINGVKALEGFINRLNAIDLPIRGLTITGPMKAELCASHAFARTVVNKAQSANVLVIKNGQVMLNTTDDIGLKKVLENNSIEVVGKKVALIGCGSSGRVAAYTLKKMGADVVLYNRSQNRGRRAEELLNLSQFPLRELSLADFDIVVNCAPFSVSDALPFYADRFNPYTIVVDFVYSPDANSLIHHARRAGLTTIDGREMFKEQVVAQFECLMGFPFPRSMSDKLDFIINKKFSEKDVCRLEGLERVPSFFGENRMG